MIPGPYYGIRRQTRGFITPVSTLYTIGRLSVGVWYPLRTSDICPQDGFLWNRVSGNSEQEFLFSTW